MEVVYVVNFSDIVTYTLTATALALGASLLIYYTLRSKRERVTEVYLAGEPESAVSMISPSIGALYWGFIRKFAKELYEDLVGELHTGSLHDWLKFISSWFGLLMLIAFITGIIIVFGR